MAFPVVCVDCSSPEESKKKATSMRTAAAGYARTKKGKRSDVHETYSFRSATEANIARIFNLENLNWKYEEKVFTFSDRKIRPFQYIPDFEIVSGSELFPPGFYEVKGYLDSEGRGRLRVFKQKYPEAAANTTVILYRSSEKRNITFCTNLGFKTMFYDKLTEKFSSRIPKWE